MKQRQMLRRQRQAAVAVRPRLVPVAGELGEHRGDVQGVGQEAVVSQTFRRGQMRLDLEPRPRQRVRVASARTPRGSARRSPNANRRCAAPASARADSSRARPATAGRSDRPTSRTRACAARAPARGGRPRSRARGRRPFAPADSLRSRSTPPRPGAPGAILPPLTRAGHHRGSARPRPKRPPLLLERWTDVSRPQPHGQRHPSAGNSRSLGADSPSPPAGSSEGPSWPARTPARTESRPPRRRAARHCAPATRARNEGARPRTHARRASARRPFSNISRASPIPPGAPRVQRAWRARQRSRRPKVPGAARACGGWPHAIGLGNPERCCRRARP